jgi:hypothetical protein
MKLFLGNVKIVVDRCEQSSYRLINETGNNKQLEGEMEAIGTKTLEFIKTLLSGDDDYDARWCYKNFKKCGFTMREWRAIIAKASKL